MLLALYLQTKEKGEEAASTTAEEFEDNLWLMMIKKFKTATRVWPLLSYDNVKIQKAVNVSHIQYAQGEEDKEVFSLDQDLNKVDLPTYSPDMNRVIEHVFGDVKQRMLLRFIGRKGTSARLKSFKKQCGKCCTP